MMNEGVNTMLNDPIRMQTADPNKIRCRDCIFRDKTQVTIGGETARVGITRDTCVIFDGKRGNWKPTEILLDGANCLMYERDETV